MPVAPRGISRAHSASDAASFSSPTSPVPTRTSRCGRSPRAVPGTARYWLTSVSRSSSPSPRRSSTLRAPSTHSISHCVGCGVRSRLSRHENSSTTTPRRRVIRWAPSRRASQSAGEGRRRVRGPSMRNRPKKPASSSVACRGRRWATYWSGRTTTMTPSRSIPCDSKMSSS